MKRFFSRLMRSCAFSTSATLSSSDRAHHLRLALEIAEALGAAARALHLEREVEHALAHLGEHRERELRRLHLARDARVDLGELLRRCPSRAPCRGAGAACAGASPRARRARRSRRSPRRRPIRRASRPCARARAARPSARRRAARTAGSSTARRAGPRSRPRAPWRGAPPPRGAACACRRSPGSTTRAAAARGRDRDPRRAQRG